MMRTGEIPAVLTIAGSDSGGGAGIQADLRTFHAYKVYGCSAVTAVTSQNPYEVRRVDVLSGNAVRCQLESVLDVIPVRFVKTGMLANHQIIKCVAEIAADRSLDLVVDPVMISTSGAKLLEDRAVEAMKHCLFPLAKWLTPNIPEAELICNRKISDPGDFADAALMLYEQYRCNVILKGGHLANTDVAADMVCCRGRLYWLTSPWIAAAGNTSHGTGCTLSAALTAGLAQGKSWKSAVISAKRFVCGSLAQSVSLSASLRQMYPPEKSRSRLDRPQLKPYISDAR